VLEQSVLIVGQRIWLTLVKLIIQNEPFLLESRHPGNALEQLVQ